MSKKLRFQVFRRDRFTCQYCGRQSPEVTLEVDHVMPVVLGGSDDQSNLVTACRDCNGSKSDKIDAVRHRWTFEQYRAMIAALSSESRAYAAAVQELSLECHARYGASWIGAWQPGTATIYPTPEGFMAAVRAMPGAFRAELLRRFAASDQADDPREGSDEPILVECTPGRIAQLAARHLSPTGRASFIAMLARFTDE